MPKTMTIDEITGEDVGQNGSSVTNSSSSGPKVMSVDEILGTTTNEQHLEQKTGPIRYVQLGLQAINTAIPNLLGVPGDIEYLGKHYLFNPATGTEHVQYLPTSNQLRQLTDRVGLTADPRVVPGAGDYPTLEKFSTAAITGAATAAPFAFTGGIPSGLELARTVVPGATGGLASEAAHEFAPDNPLLNLAAGIVGGIAGGGIVGTAERYMKRNAARQAGSTATKAEELAKSNIEQNPLSIQGLKNYWNDLGSRVNLEARQRTDDAVATAENTIESIASKYGTATNPKDAGRALQDSARNWLSNYVNSELAGGTIDSAEAAMYKRIAEGPIAKIVAGVKQSKKDPNPETIIDKLTPEDIAILRGQIPGAVGQITASKIRSGKWNDLSGDEQAIIVPDPIHRRNLNEAINIKGTAEKNLEAILVGTDKTKKEMIDYGTGLLKGITGEQKKQAGALRNLADDLRGNITEQALHNHLIKFLAGYEGGGALGNLLLSHVFPADKATAIGQILGLAAPPIVRSLRERPLEIGRAAGVGALGAQANPLIPTEIPGDPMWFSWGQGGSPNR